MALARAASPRGRKSRFLDFWRNSAEFDPIAGGPGPISPALASWPPGAALASRGAVPGPGITASGPRCAVPGPVRLGHGPRGGAGHVSLI